MSRKIKNTNNSYILEGNTHGFLKIPKGNNPSPPSLNDGSGSIRYNEIQNRIEIYVSSLGWVSLAFLNDVVSTTSLPFVLKTGDIISGDIVFSSGKLVLSEGSSNSLSLNFSTHTNTGLVYNNDTNSLEIYNSGVRVLYFSNNDFIRLGVSSNNILLDNTGNILINIDNYAIISQNIPGDDNYLILQNVSAKSILTFRNQSTTNYNIIYDSEIDRLYFQYDVNFFKNLLLTNDGKVLINVSSQHSASDTLEVRGTIKIIGENIYKLPTSAGNPGQYLISNGPGNHLYWSNSPSTSLNFVSFGSGVDFFIAVSGTDVYMKTISGGGIVEVSSDPSGLIIISAPAFLSNITNSALGGGIDPILAVSGGEIITRTFVGGGIVEVSATSDGRIIVSGASQVQNLSLSSLANGVDVISNVSGSEIIQRRIQGKGIVDVRLSSNGTVVVSSMDNNFAESNFRLITQRNFYTSPGTLEIYSDLSAYNEVYVTFFNVFTCANSPLAFMTRINNTLVTISGSYRYNTFSIVDGSSVSGFFINDMTIITNNVDNSTNNRKRRSVSGYIRFFSPNNLNLVSAVTSWISEMRHITQTGEEVYLKTVGRNNYSTTSGTKFEGLSIFVNSSNVNIAGGLIKVYGRL